ncbi:MAG: LysM peptidoglycan-binding domain-containing protein [Magnetococcus sp. DMHC-6]
MKKKYFYMLFAFGLSAISAPVWGEEGATSDPHTVIKGDTLWQISADHLKDPMAWPHIWQKNPQIKNPHWIYPGDKVQLGSPIRTDSSAGQENRELKRQVVKLFPHMQSGPVVRQEVVLTEKKRIFIRHFLQKSGLIQEEAVQGEGVVIGSPTGRHLLGKSDLVLVRFAKPTPVGIQLTIFGAGSALTDPETSESLGIIANRLGTLRVVEVTPEGPIALIEESYKPISPGDRLALLDPANMDIQLQDNLPHSMRGSVLEIVDALGEGGSNQVVAVGVGRRNKAVLGAVLDVYRQKIATQDPETGGQVWFPNKKIGYAVLFYVGEKASFALLSGTSEPIHRGDQVMAGPNLKDSQKSL